MALDLEIETVDLEIETVDLDLVSAFHQAGE